MAGPIIQMLQGLRERRQRRRSGWGGGDAPGMRNIINPLDSQQMSDRSQGVDISSAMPSTRLETRVSEPVAESLATGQLPQPASNSTVTPPAEPQPERRGPFMTAAGSNANPQPMTGSQYPAQYFGQQPGVCTGPNCQQGGGERIINERVTHINGVPVEQLQGQATAPSSPQPSQQAAPGQPQGQQAGAAFDPAQAFSAWQGFVSRGAENPASVDWLGAANAAAAQADNFYKLHHTATSPSWKVYYGQQAAYWQRESFNALKTHMLAQNLAPRQQMAERAMERGSPMAQFRDVNEFLTTPNMDAPPDDRAAFYARTLHPELKDDAQVTAHPDYQEARRRAHAGEIAHHAALAATQGDTESPWGTEDSRAAGASSAWNNAKAYYGGMNLEDASNEIDKVFKPNYLKALTKANAALPRGEQQSAAELRDRAELHSRALLSYLAYDQDPGIGAQRSEAEPQQPAPQKPAAGGAGFFNHSPSLWGGM